MICPDCGREFDPAADEASYDAYYEPMYSYGNFSQEICLVCAVHYTELGLVDTNFLYGDDGQM